METKQQITASNVIQYINNIQIDGIFEYLGMRSTIGTIIMSSNNHNGENDDEPIDDLVVKVASNELNFDDLKAWFAPRLIRR